MGVSTNERQLGVGFGGETPPSFSSFEWGVINTLQGYLSRDSNPPLLTNNEEDLIINHDPSFFDAISQRSVPRDAPHRLKTGELSEDDIARKMRIGRNIVRREKADMYVDRLMTAVFAADTCRSQYLLDNGREFVPVLEDDTPETVGRRVGDYVTDLLVAGRERRVLRGAAMDRLTQTIRQKYDADVSSARVLTVMAGQNSMKKVNLYADQLATTSKGFDRMNAETKHRLMEYMARRPLTFQGKPDLVEMLVDRAGR